MIERTEQLAAQAAEDNAQRERRTAVTAAFRELARTGSGITPAALTRLAESRVDGSTATLRDPARNESAGSTNNSDHVTHASNPLESHREDY